MTLSAFDDLLASISERAFFSGWQSGIEFRLWFIATGATDAALGGTRVSDPELALLRDHLITEKSWLTFDSERQEPILVPLTRWLSLCDLFRADATQFAHIYSVNVHR